MSIQTAPAPGDPTAETWDVVCLLDDLLPERGVAALVHDTQVAVFRLHDDTVLAVQQRDPYSGANVLSRGIVGTRTVDGTEVPTIASPMYKQVFDLRTGTCLETVGQNPRHLRTWPVRVVAGVVEIGTPA
ncbi:nitrite reductase small subunit NirD [Cellulomonas bogoriensis]|uniref:Nitrite reductase n=1 Tax=Cellulomonas bogoriensis 69B4 = DSM 16987 TaxID=1386082 RepID=A0A0A0BQX3_9CELL|nr:nitrite reductase small subunit NirD [Cellulomonas bogoriensis]KGM10868.1 nitrite reductase [Cellulomonas bogoriensis 69B4 = DSM 16987]